MRAGGVPVAVDLDGRRVVVVGAGPVAEGKIASLTAVGAPAVTVVAPEATPGIRAAAAEGRVRWEARGYADGDLAEAWLVVAAAASAAVNGAVAAEAERRRIWCVRADDAEGGSAAVLAAVRRGPLLLAVSTSGASPALSRRIRSELAVRYGPEYGEVAELLGELRMDARVRSALAAVGARERRARWRAVLDADIVALVREGRRSEAREVAAACLCSSSD